MSIETILIWMAIGLVAGWLASRVVGGGYGVIGDIVLGIVGAFLGGLIFRALHLHSRSEAWPRRYSSPSWAPSSCCCSCVWSGGSPGAADERVSA